jgi:chemotaxis signal transduction protein
MTLRNRLLPLVSLRRMFALPDSDLDEKSRIVVLTLGVSVGVVVDAVSEVLRVAKSGVDPLPAVAGPRRESRRDHFNLPAGQWKAPGVDHPRAICSAIPPSRRH